MKKTYQDYILEIRDEYREIRDEYRWCYGNIENLRLSFQDHIVSTINLLPYGDQPKSNDEARLYAREIVDHIFMMMGR